MKVLPLLLLLEVVASSDVRSVADLSFVTWNADASPSWNAVQRYFLLSNATLMAIQGAAELPPTRGAPNGFRAVAQEDWLATSFLGAATAPFHVEQYLWNATEGDQLHLYYYADRHNPPSSDSSGGATNLAILSRRPADQLFLVPLLDNALLDSAHNPASSDSRHPLLMGLRFGSALFFNYDARDGDSAAVVHLLTNLTAAHYPASTWALAGDFRQTPAHLEQALGQLPAPLAGTFRRVVATGAATRVPRPWDRRRTRPDALDETPVGRRSQRYRKRGHNRRRNLVASASGYRTMLQLKAANDPQFRKTSEPAPNSTAKWAVGLISGFNMVKSLSQSKDTDGAQLPEAAAPGRNPMAGSRTLLQLEATEDAQLLASAETMPAAIHQRRQKQRLRAAARRQWRKSRRAATSREVDYAVFGGPVANRHIMMSVSVELLKNYVARLKLRSEWYVPNPSHHLPLIFNAQL